MKDFKFTLFILISFLACLACSVGDNDNAWDEDDHFDIKFEIKEGKDELYDLCFTVELDSGYYFVSPHSEGHHQRLIFSLENTDSLLLNDKLLEIPFTFDEYDNLSNKIGRFVRKTTEYQQRVELKTQNEFEVKGMVWIEVLPARQPYEVDFLISYNSGKLNVIKTNTRFSDYPTFFDLKRLD